uniref:Tripartite motif containing 25, like n=1 Tax=Sinocyclocheilus rhinocerous TaxID=307959 RepID=A0A673IHQ4_9TELE
MSARLWTEEQFNCPVCLDLPSDPVTIPCGHSYCKACIADYWDNEGRKNGTYSCPECRQTFSPRPTLCRNTMLAELPGSAVPCDRCPEPRAAVKTCLVCMASFCETHLKPHNTQEKLKSHELIAPTGDLSQKICPEHKYLQEFFCRSCQMYVCWLCTSNQHKGHETSSVCLCSVQRMLELLQDVMVSTAQEKLNEAQEVVTKLEAEVKQLKKKDGELKELINFYSSCIVLFILFQAHFLNSLSLSLSFSYLSLSLSLSPLDACDLTLDPNTAHRRLVLSDGDTVATLQQTSQPFPDLPQRFDGWTQVLCLQPLSSDRCYWEVEWRGRGSSLGVVSGSMSRKGADTGAGLGYNSKSWSLELSDMCCAAMHANKKVEIPVTYSPRVGVFLDRTAGTLTFYSVDDELVPLHAFQGSFPPPLYAAFGVGCGVGVGLDFAMGQFSSTSDSIKICPL